MPIEMPSMCGRCALELFPFRQIAIGDKHGGAFLEERRGNRASQSAGAAGDQNYAAVESRGHCHLWGHTSAATSLGSVTIMLQPFGHQEAVVIFVASAAIKFQRGIVAAVDFEMNGVNAHFASFLFDENHGLAAKTAAAMSRNDIEFIDESVVATKFETEADGQDDVADELGGVVKQPDAAEGGKR